MDTLAKLVSCVRSGVNKYCVFLTSTIDPCESVEDGYASVVALAWARARRTFSGTNGSLGSGSGNLGEYGKLGGGLRLILVFEEDEGAEDILTGAEPAGQGDVQLQRAEEARSAYKK